MDNGGEPTNPHLSGMERLAIPEGALLAEVEHRITVQEEAEDMEPLRELDFGEGIPQEMNRAAAELIAWLYRVKRRSERNRVYHPAPETHA